MLGGQDTRVIYRHYATLYFVFVVDESESELGILDLIQVTHWQDGVVHLTRLKAKLGVKIRSGSSMSLTFAFFFGMNTSIGLCGKFG